MSKKRTFHKTTIMVEVLSEDPFDPNENLDLAHIREAITTGDCSGRVCIVGREEMQGPRAAKELMAQGSDPGFFRLDEEGNDLEDV